MIRVMPDHKSCLAESDYTADVSRRQAIFRGEERENEVNKIARKYTHPF